MKIYAFSLVCILFIVANTFAQTTYTLISSGDWDNPAKWSPEGIPGNNDFVIVKDHYVNIYKSVTLSGFSFNDASVNFKDSNIVISIADSAVWYGGEIDGGGIAAACSVIVLEGALFILDSDNLEPESHRLYEGTTLINRGIIKHSGSTNLNIRGNSVLYNESVYDLQSDADFHGESFSGGKFINTGTFRKSGGTDISYMSFWWVFENFGGTIESKSGTFRFECDGTFSDAVINADEGASILFISHIQLFNGTISGSPKGTVKLSNASITIDSTGAELNFKNKGFQFEAGSISGGGTLTIPEGALLVINGTSENPILSGGTTILNKGTIKQEGSKNLSIKGNSVIENLSLFEVATDAGFTGGPGSGGTFLNKGTLLKSSGDNITSFNLWWNFVNEGGNIDVKTGTLDFTGNGIYTGGNLNAHKGAVISFTGGTHLFKGKINGSPEGIVKLSDATISIDSNGAELNFTGTGFQWDAGYLSNGVMTIPEGALLVINGMTENPQLYKATLLNKGIIRMEGSKSITARSGIIDNQSLFEVTTDAGFTGGPGSGGNFLNSGIFHKIGGSNVTSFNIWWDFSNLEKGIIGVDSGEVSFYSLENFESSIITGSSKITVPGSFINQGTTSPGNSAGSLSYTGNLTLSPSSTIDIELGGYSTVTLYDQLIVTGRVYLNGTLKVSLINDFVPAKGDTFVVITSSGTIADSFSGISPVQGLYVSTKVNPNSVVIVIDSVGTLVSVEDDLPVLVNEFNLEQNFPNPFNPSTNIQFSIAGQSTVKLEVFNAIGECVDVLVNETLNPGIYNYHWNASGYASGVYFYTISAGSFKQSRKMLLIK